MSFWKQSSLVYTNSALFTLLLLWFHLSSICILTMNYYVGDAWYEMRTPWFDNSRSKKEERKKKKRILTTHWNWMRNHHSFYIISNVCVMRKVQFTLLAFYHFVSYTLHLLQWQSYIGIWYACTGKVHRKWFDNVREWTNIRLRLLIRHTRNTDQKKIAETKHMCVLWICCVYATIRMISFTQLKVAIMRGSFDWGTYFCLL